MAAEKLKQHTRAFVVVEWHDTFFFFQKSNSAAANLELYKQRKSEGYIVFASAHCETKEECCNIGTTVG